MRTELGFKDDLAPTDRFWDLEYGTVKFLHQDQDEEMPNTHITDEFASVDEVLIKSPKDVFMNGWYRLCLSTIILVDKL